MLLIHKKETPHNMEEELEILQGIYFDDIIQIELEGSKPFVEILLHPSSDEEIENNKLIKVVMKAYFPTNYPEEVPIFEFSAAKGMTDDFLKNIQTGVKDLAENIKGEPMIFEIIQFIKEKLSDLGSLPENYVCSICLSGFEQQTDIYYLQCYHYFHEACLYEHFKHMEKDIEIERNEALKYRLEWKERKPTCPECRTDLTQSELDLFRQMKNPKIKPDNTHCIVISDTMRQTQARMRAIYERQKNAGGIISENDQEIITLTQETESTETPDKLEMDLLNLTS